MKEIKSSNYVIPDKFRRTLKKGEYAAYQLVDVGYTPDGKFIGRTFGIPNKDIILDEEGNTIPIGFVEGWGGDGLPIFGRVWFPVDSQCTIVCMHGARHANLYNFLEITNFNESNPNRDPNSPALFRRVDSSSNARQTREQRNERVQALKTVISMSNDEVLDFLENNKNISVRITSLPNGEKDWNAIRDSLERFAEQNPHIIMSSSTVKKSSDDAEVMALVKSCVDKQVIGFDRETKSWYGATGKPFLKVLSAKDNAQVHELVSYLKSAQGLKMYEKLLDASKAQ